MGQMFAKPEAPVAPPPPPTPDDSGVKKKLDEAADLQRKAQGRASTVLTGGRGLMDSSQSPVSSARTLLGS